MDLRNKKDKQIYTVRTEDDRHGDFRIYATPRNLAQLDKSFVMHYKTLAEFCGDWEDID